MTSRENPFGDLFGIGFPFEELFGKGRPAKPKVQSYTLRGDSIHLHRAE
jgi:hypothetical protein